MSIFVEPAITGLSEAQERICEKIAGAAGQLARIERIETAAQMRLAKTIREADQAQISKAAIARAAGVSRPYVYEILRRG